MTIFIKSEAERLGFDICGIAKAEAVAPDVAAMYNSWVGLGKHATMGYLERNSEKRLNPTCLSRDARVSSQ